MRARPSGLRLDLQISNSSQLDRSSMFLGHHKMAIAAYSIPYAGVLPTSAACMCWRVPHNVILTCYVVVLHLISPRWLEKM